MTGTETALAGTAFGAIAEAVASDTPTPGGGAVAGLTAALAAGLAAMVARYSAAAGDLDPAAVATRADELRRTAQRLADDDVRAYQRYLDVTKPPEGPDPAARKAAIRAALDAAADIPLALAVVAAEVTELGELLAEAGNPRLHSDALTAVQLGSAVATSAAALVGENLRARRGDPRPTRAAERAAVARAAAARVAGEPAPTTSESTPIRKVRP
ncbi:cyclodeaminase/cyclohydrolase family protein [Amycolatopsis sp. FDAARGOS 1241]|uniref:cyclodeaminase/cyclohydrolase family protein n=1 Tax=Amycolatopsis sp. FDAARGOS 1241 TaxID=2778070 RepID=UPI00194EEC40|nr:cyclodeaminase/cyclohydrolase family protein [Amycolatopsis sp. FDAARGOS 1241]QRP48845.1 cyclodeaminase/cyclohydrolase family protein [Amycolatopsis sp. FDAARGOS 1241]